MGVDVVFPGEVLVILREGEKEFKKRALIYTLGKLYQDGKISGGYCAQILGCTKREFYRTLSEHGFPVIDLGEEDKEEELQGSRKLAEHLKSR